MLYTIFDFNKLMISLLWDYVKTIVAEINEGQKKYLPKDKKKDKQ
jgi:hypothetical protein